jgi:3-mercaptopyruvate sulfurtransferase SseA
MKRFAILTAVIGFLFLARPATAEEGVQGRLVSAAWLQRNLNQAGLLVLDASPAQAYAAGHIPGAVSVDIFVYGVPEAPVSEMEKRFQSWGVSQGKKVVIYDPGANMQATRFFFSLEYYGFPVRDLFILNGGFAKWQEAGGPVTKEPTPDPAKGTFKVVKLNPEAKAELPEFLSAAGDPANCALLDALTAGWHFGETLVFDRAGHIPRGILTPSADFFNPDKTFKSAADIGKMMAYFGVRPEQRVYTFCGGGVAASVPYFALKFILNYPQVKLYQESEMGWLFDDRGLPYWTYDAPYLMRGANWLQAWGTNQMMRSVGINRLSIIDVRPAEAYNRGHVAFALNIPADSFRSRLAEPARLAETLGPAGVDSNHEAVLVSGAGLTIESALAFLMLEKAGQKKVSILIDSLDQWTKLGFALKTDPTAVGPKKAPNDISIPPTTYPGSGREGILIADPKKTRGIYPKVFVASGPNASTRAVDGQAVHLPYTSLLLADGTPKAAKDIWTILVKAGIPRYAEIICYSDDPGEAAANYFLFKLMGFPDVKVWAY